MSAVPAPSLAATESTCVPLVLPFAPALSAWDAFQHLADLPYPLFLDSALANPQLGRYSFVTADPFETLRSAGQKVWLSDKLVSSANPWQALHELLARWRSPTVAGLPPFQGGAAGLWGYELCRHLERIPRARLDDFSVPDLALGFYDWVLAFDHLHQSAWLISTGFPETEPRQRFRRAEQRAKQVLRWLREPSSQRPSTCVRATPGLCLPARQGVFSNMTEAQQLAMIQQGIDYVHQGDCFQVNLSQRLLAPATSSPLELYSKLRSCNAAPFAGYFSLGDFTLLSASPERFLKLEQGWVETRPIKGTVRRSMQAGEDEERRRQLQTSSKDRAENVMIVDLLRNDLGRVCRYGSVQVSALCRLESYAYVHHLVSEVRGQLRPDCTALELLKAAFPGGSVSGAPKVRALEIIAELEPTVRGPYCGSLGYIGFDGNMDTNLLIRTFTLGSGWLQFPVGGGIVADSDPRQEVEETWNKAAGLLKALPNVAI